MPHFYERNITEIKEEFSTFLISTLAPLIYEGLRRMYKSSIAKEKEFADAEKKKPGIENPGVLGIFKIYLNGLKNLNSQKIEEETIRVRDSSKIADIFDDLIRSVVKSHIILLTFNVSGKTCMVVKERWHDNVDINNFIHKCYIESGKIFYNNPRLFWHNYPTHTLQKNKTICLEVIKKAIKESIIKILPMKLILEEYLSNDYVKEQRFANRYMRIKNGLRHQSGGSDGESILEEGEEEEMYEDDYEEDREGESAEGGSRDEDDEAGVVNKFDDGSGIDPKEYVSVGKSIENHENSKKEEDNDIKGDTRGDTGGNNSKNEENENENEDEVDAKFASLITGGGSSDDDDKEDKPTNPNDPENISNKSGSGSGSNKSNNRKKVTISLGSRRSAATQFFGSIPERGGDIKINKT